MAAEKQPDEITPLAEKAPLVEEQQQKATPTRPSRHVVRAVAIVIIALSVVRLWLRGDLPTSWTSSPSAPSEPRPSLTQLRARKILKEHPLIDGHNDLLIRTYAEFGNHFYFENFSKPFEHGGFGGNVDLPRIHTGLYGGAFWSAYYPCPYDIFDFSTPNYDPIVRATLGQLDAFNRLQELYPDTFPPTPDARTAERNFKAGKLISPVAVEGLHQIGNSFANLRLYHKLGVRYATLNWNCHNAYSDAAVLTYPANQSSLASWPYWGGLSPKGRELVDEMNRLGMIVDLSHVSVNTMIEVLNGTHNDNMPAPPQAAAAALPQEPNARLAAGDQSAAKKKQRWPGSRAPPIFSHSSAYALCPHPRNVPDEVLHLVRARNSLVMVNFNPDFVACRAPAANAPWGALPDYDDADNTLEHVVRHIRHIGELIGYEHVGIGTDYDGIEHTPRGLEGVDKFPALVEALLRAGLSDKDVIKVIGGNLLRVWHAVDRVAAELQAAGVRPAEDAGVGWPGLSDPYW